MSVRERIRYLRPHGDDQGGSMEHYGGVHGAALRMTGVWFLTVDAGLTGLVGSSEVRGR